MFECVWMGGTGVLKVSWGEKVDKYREKREFRGSVGEEGLSF